MIHTLHKGVWAQDIDMKNETSYPLYYKTHWNPPWSHTTPYHHGSLRIPRFRRKGGFLHCATMRLARIVTGVLLSSNVRYGFKWLVRFHRNLGARVFQTSLSTMKGVWRLPWDNLLVLCKLSDFPFFKIFSCRISTFSSRLSRNGRMTKIIYDRWDSL